MKVRYGIILAILGILLFTRIDFLINNILYKYGLKFSEGWYSEYGILYFLLYQFLIAIVYLLTKNVKLAICLEVFTQTSTQDLIYFGLWEGSFPTYDWVWMPYYKIFGTWMTIHQVCLSLLALGLIVLIWRIKLDKGNKRL